MASDAKITHLSMTQGNIAQHLYNRMALTHCMKEVYTNRPITSRRDASIKVVIRWIASMNNPTVHTFPMYRTNTNAGKKGDSAYGDE